MTLIAIACVLVALTTATSAGAWCPECGDIVTKEYTDFGWGHKMETTSIFYRRTGYVQTGTYTWTEGWTGFHGCVNSSVLDWNGNWIASSQVYKYGTTWDKRYDGFGWYVPSNRLQDVGSLVVKHFKC